MSVGMRSIEHPGSNASTRPPGRHDVSTAELLRGLAESDAVAFRFEEQAWTYRQLVGEGSRRAARFGELRDPARPPHIGVLLDNVPDYLFWLTAAALSGSVVVGINATYRGDQLGLLIRHTDCQILVTDRKFDALLDGVDTGFDADRVLRVDAAAYADDLAVMPTELPQRSVSDDDLFLLIFTSGSTGLPKAVRCTQGRYARTGAHVARIAALVDGDAVYAPLPFFHTSSLFTGWSAALNAGIPFSTRVKFSASNTLPDIRRLGATMLTYTGKVLNYIPATTE